MPLHRRHRVRLTTAGAALALLVATVLGFAASVPPSPQLAAATPVVFMGAGDIAACGDWSEPNAVATGDLIREANPDKVFALGDNAYDDGTLQQYQDCYDPAWGSFKAKTYPVPGNHEYHTTNAQGYLDYFGTSNVQNTTNGGTYYAVDLGNGWRYYALNSEVSMSAGSAQLAWLESDLAANAGKHIIAGWHKPRYSDGMHGSRTSVCGAWDALQAAGADIVLSGHDHLYNRYPKADCDGNASATGLRQFVAGAGGNQTYAAATTPPIAPTVTDYWDFGVLKLELLPGSYSWEYVASGRQFSDSLGGFDSGNKGQVLDSGTEATNNAPGTVDPSPSPTETATAEPTPTETATVEPTPTETPTEAGFPTSRNKYEWPFHRDSIWNRPIGEGAVYVDAGLFSQDSATQPDEEYLGLNPNDPLKTLTGNDVGDLGQVHVPPYFAWDGRWNGGAAFLRPDGDTVWQGQPLVLEAGGDPSWDTTAVKYDRLGNWLGGAAYTVSLSNDKGAHGAHGGSGLSTVGGTIREGELTGTEPIRHALKINIDCRDFCYYDGTIANSHRWPATNADDPLSESRYGGTNPSVVPGALLALPPNFDLSTLQTEQARKIARALKFYGAYITDETAGDYFAFSVEYDALDEWRGGDGWYPNLSPDDPAVQADLNSLYGQLKVIDNNSPTTVGGGGTPLQPLAPPFEDTTSPSPTPTETATVEPTPTETATVEPTPTETATVEPTPTETATVEPSPTPTEPPPNGAAHLVCPVVESPTVGQSITCVYE